MRNEPTPAQAADINKSATEQNRIAKAKDELLAQQAANDQAWYEFRLKFCGGVAVNNRLVFYDCVANRSMLEGHVRAANRVINSAALEEAFMELRKTGTLAEPKIEQERHTDLQRSRIAPQPLSSIVRIPKPAVHLGFTREELIKMAREKFPEFKKLVQKFRIKGPEYEKELNRILNAK
jgi:hypothetical protein